MILLNLLLNRALIRSRESLRRKTLACWAKAGVIHSDLEGVVLPAEDVVSVLAVPSTVMHWLLNPGWCHDGDMILTDRHC